MAKILLGALAVLITSLPAPAEVPGDYAYVFAGPVIVPKSAYTRWDGDFIHVGGGGEGRLTDRFALGGEVGVFKPITNQYAVTTGQVSGTPAFHFLSRHGKSKVDPFVDGGLSLLFGRGGALAVHYGGGVNYWLTRRVGLRVEFRHHIWSEGSAVHMVGLRLGVVFGAR